MNLRCAVPLIGLALSACAPQDRTPDELVLLDEPVTLTRTARGDTVTRQIKVDSESVIVAQVDEQQTDVHLALSSKDGQVDVENNLEGVGFEIAALPAHRYTLVKITISGRPNAAQPGTVRLHVTRFRAKGNAPYASRLTAQQAWSEGTRASLRPAEFKAKGAAALEVAVTQLSGKDGDPRLAVQAQLVKANALRYFQGDLHESLLAARAAERGIQALKLLNDLSESRARYVEARTLLAISGERDAKDPTPEEAAKLAREILAPLAGPNSSLPAIEFARAMGLLGEVELNASQIDDAEKHFTTARTIYHDAGYKAGEREMNGRLALALLERGRFRDAAQALEAIVPELDQVTDPQLRADLTLGAARGQSFAGRTDRAVELQLKALDLAREYQLRVSEASALQGLGHVYQNRGDLLQARSFFAEALRIMREENQTLEYVWGLSSAGVVAREDGDFPQAIKLHEEAVKLAFNPIAKVRTLRELGLDYTASQNNAAAIEQFRAGLAVKLQDPKHHAYSDVKRNLAQALVDDYNDRGAAAHTDFKEVSRLIDETLASSLKVGDKLGVIGAHRVRANLLASQGRSAEAMKEYKQTFALAKEYRDSSSSTEARGATLTHEQYALRGYLDLALKDVPAGTPRRASKGEEEALYTLERARDTYYGRARTGELDKATTAQVDAVLTQMADKSVKIATLLRTPNSSKNELADLQAEMSDLHAELDRVRTEAASKRKGNEVAAAPVLRALAQDAVQVSYALGNRHGYVWARSSKGVIVAALTKAPKDLEQELIALGALDRQVAPAAVEAALAGVSAELLPKGLLPPNTSSVEIVAEGRIAAVPFAGLQSPDEPDNRLVETHTISMITSMYAGETPPRLAQARPFRLVALASGTSGLRSVPVVNPATQLQAATSEVRAVAKLFAASDPAANIRLLVAPEGSAAELHQIWGSGADVVHFATHALADLRQPQASLLVLPATDKAGAPTYLTAGQVEGWRGDTELVFLSACDSAVGPPRFAGGMPGLQRAFLRAGARGVIATLWPIEDVLAQEFSADFYERYTRGVPAPQALRETQQAWLTTGTGRSDADQARRRITALAHGFYSQ